jgi:putative transposase
MISKNHAIVFIEDLKVSSMSRSASGTQEEPGRTVAAKSGLNKSILDQGWGEFRRQLEYKQVWRGGYVIAVPPQYTSQTCPACGHVAKENRQTQAVFNCVACGFFENADLVGAINIRAVGHTVLACGESAQSGRSAKQEPAEVAYACA